MPRKSWREALATYANPATLALLLLGFAAGLPYMLVFSTLSVWLREAGVARETIGFASLIGLAYAFKWVWAPMLDQWRLPLLGKLGRRRSWLVLSQGLVAIGLIGMANYDPQTHLSSLIALAVLVAFASATQDIAVDAYRLEILGDEHQAALAAAYMTGYRVAALLATAGALYFAEGFGSTAKDYQFSAWTGTYMLFALLMLPGLLTSIWMREPPAPPHIHVAPPKHGFFHQLLAISAVIMLIIAVPTMFIQFYQSDLVPMLLGDVSMQELLYNDRAFLRAMLYSTLACVCASGLFWGGLAPVLKTAAARYGFFHQLLSVLLLIILLIAIPAMVTQFYESDLMLLFQGQISLQELLYYDRAFLLLISVASMIGVETTSFIAMIGAAGLAIGLALQGSLANFAGGVLIMLFRPFRAGDWIEGQGVSGSVDSIQIFHTTLKTADNKVVIVPNGALSNGHITNYSREPRRRADINIGIDYSSDIKRAREVLLDIAKDPRVQLDPAPVVFVTGLGESAVNISLRVWVATGDFWPVTFEFTELAKERLTEAGIGIPFPQRVVHLAKAD